MDHELICTWLGLPPGQWPPDHYTLLNLEPGEADQERIEQHAHERLACLRCHQLTNPDLATEAMNRLAQAVVCLTDPRAKKAYDAALAGEQPAADAAGANSEVEQPTTAEVVAATADPLAWLFGPWNPANAAPTTPTASPATTIDWSTSPPPPRLPTVPTADPLTTETVVGSNGTAEMPAASATDVPLAPVSTPATPGTPPVDPVVAAARSSAPARRGLLTKRGLYNRVARTRQLLRAWEQAGRYLRDPQRSLARRAEATDLVHQLSTIRQLLRSFPPLLGEAGQPGYSVIALARQQLIVQTFQTLLASQRQVLARDWKDGQTLLTAHREFLREELRALRRKGIFGRTARAVRTFLADHPGFWLLVIGLAALNLAVLPLLQKLEDARKLEGARWQVLFLLAQLVLFVVVLGVGVAQWRKNFRRAWLDRSTHPRQRQAPSRTAGVARTPAAPQVRSSR